MGSNYCFGCNSITLYQVKLSQLPKNVNLFRPRSFCVKASKIDSSGSSNFVHNMERAWLISQQPGPVACSSCDTKGHVECQWCGGTGFFILGDNMMCQIPSRNTSCVICAGKGSARCSDCKGTGYRAKWLDQSPTDQ